MDRSLYQNNKQKQHRKNYTTIFSDCNILERSAVFQRISSWIISEITTEKESLKCDKKSLCFEKRHALNRDIPPLQS